MVIAGSDKTTRRRSVRRQQESSAPRYGPELRQAREQLDLTLEVIGDRTGIPGRDLEALETCDLSRFRDERAALVAVRRFADTVGLDSAAIMQAVEAQWRSVVEGPGLAFSAMTMAPPAQIRPAGPGPASVGVGPAVPAPAIPSPAIRPLADSTHLRAFTQTAEVPRVAGAPPPRATLPPGLRFDSTDAIPVVAAQPAPAVHRGRRHASTGVRVAVWTLVLLLVVGVAGLSIDHWRPGWLAKIHLVGSAPPPSSHARPGAGSAAKTPLVTSTTSGPRAATVSVRSPAFQVVVATRQACWINVTSPASAVPIFSTTVPAGTTKIFTSVNGQLSVELGASGVLVAVQILGKTAPGWILAPSSVPYVVTFHSVTG